MNIPIQDWRKRLERLPRSPFVGGYLAVISIVTIAVYAMTLPAEERMRAWFAHSTYYFLWLLVVGWLITAAAIFRRTQFDWRSALRKNAAGAALALALTTGIFASCHPYLRVLADESNLIDISRVMTYEKQASQATTGVFYYRNFNPSSHETPPKKALFYPFAVHLLHTLTGVRVENAYAVNFLVLFAIFLLVFHFMRRAFGALWAAGTVFLVAAQPVVTQSATSAGFDLFTAFIFLVNFVALRLYLKRPEPLTLLFLALNLLVLGHSRQECVIFIPIVAALLVARGAVKLDHFRNGLWAFFAAFPLLGAPLVWHRILASRIDPFESGEEAAFAVRHFISNNLIFLKTLGHFEYFLPFATFVNWIAVGGVIWFVDRLVTRELKIEKLRADFLIIAGTCLAVYWTIFMAYFRGMMDHPSNSRYYTLFFILFSIVAAIALKQLSFRGFRLQPPAFLVVALALFFIYQPQTAEDRFSRTQSLPREYVFVRDFLKGVEKKSGRNFLVVAERPGLFTIHDYGSISSDMLNNDPIFVENWRMNLFDEVYVVQDIDSRGKPTAVTALQDRFVLEPVAAMQNGPETYLRISRLKEIRVDFGTLSKPSVPAGAWEYPPQREPGKKQVEIIAPVDVGPDGKPLNQKE